MVKKAFLILLLSSVMSTHAGSVPGVRLEDWMQFADDAVGLEVEQQVTIAMIQQFLDVLYTHGEEGISSQLMPRMWNRIYSFSSVPRFLVPQLAQAYNSRTCKGHAVVAELRIHIDALQDRSFHDLCQQALVQEKSFGG